MCKWLLGTDPFKCIFPWTAFFFFLPPPHAPFFGGEKGGKSKKVETYNKAITRLYFSAESIFYWILELSLPCLGPLWTVLAGVLAWEDMPLALFLATTKSGKRICLSLLLWKPAPDQRQVIQLFDPLSLFNCRTVWEVVWSIEAPTHKNKIIWF